ncbi:MAG: hypothetical protein WDN28_00500 [Chthoniobacter sp.]
MEERRRRGRGRTRRHLSQLGRNPPPHVGLRRHRAYYQAPPARRHPASQSGARESRSFYWNFKITTDLLELRNLATVAGLIVDSALLRKESRGLHYTLDFPETDPKCCRPTVLRRN